MPRKGEAYHKLTFSEVADRCREIPDSKLIVKSKAEELPIDHWCEGCGFATRLHDRYMCPFIAGSCVRLPGSLEKPSPELLRSRIRYDRIYTQAHKEVFEEVKA